MPCSSENCDDGSHYNAEWCIANILIDGGLESVEDGTGCWPCDEEWKELCVPAILSKSDFKNSVEDDDLWHDEEQCVTRI